MDSRVRVGVIGTTPYAEGVHLRTIGSHPRVEVVALCGRDRARAQEVAARHGISAVFTDYREMIGRGNLDAIVIVARDELHHPMTMDALDAGLHVLCEKPLVSTAAQAREMYERAEQVGVRHMSFFNLRGSPYMRHLRRLIDEGYLGRCYAAQLSIVNGFGRSGAYQWRFDRGHGTGALGDLGCYAIDLAHWFVGDIARVGAQLNTFVDRPAPDGQPYEPANDSAVLAVGFEDGAQGTIHASVVSHVAERGQHNRVTLHGEAGTLELDATFAGGELRGARTDGERFATLPLPDDLDPAANRDHSVGDRAFIEAIVEDRPVAPSFYDGWRVQQVIDAAFASHEQGRWIPIPDGPA